MTLVCITNDHPELRPCTIRGEHATQCDGFGRRWDADTETRIPTDAACKGCLPAPAEHGLLCFSCWEKLQDGLSKAVDVITHLRSVDRAQQIDKNGVRASPAWVIPIPNTWRMADDLIVLLGHPEPGFRSTADEDEVEAVTRDYVDAIDAQLWVSTTDGAYRAVRFNAIMHQALVQHPMEDYEHRIRNVRCPECKQRSLLWKPPLMFKSEIRVECQNRECGFVVDQTGYAALTATEVVEVKAKLADEKKQRAALKRAAARAERLALKEAAKRARAAAEASDAA